MSWGTGMAGRRGIEVRNTGQAISGPAGVSISGYHSGDITTVHVHGREPVPWPHQVGVVPREAVAFQDRAADGRLRAVVAQGGTAVVCQVVRGTGGVGKTQLAAHHARQAWRAGELDVLVWVSAGSRPAITSVYAQAAEELLGLEPGDPEQSAQRFLRWLEPRPPGDQPACRWLVVLDDVTDPDDLKGLWPPDSPHGRTVVTTRRRDDALAAGRQTVEVGVFTPDEALAYLTTRLTGHHESADRLRALAADLGHLPLALAQAAAYVIDAGETVDGYRNLLADRRTALTALTPDALPDDQATPLAAAWSLSVERADTLRPAGLARPMLQLVSFLDPNGIPQDVLTSRPALTHLATHRTNTGEQHGQRRKWWPGRKRTSQASVSRKEAVQVLRALHRLSLIDHIPSTAHQAVRVHQLVQRATRDDLTPHRHDQIASTAADALLAAWPEVARDTDLAQTLRANTTALTTLTDDVLFQQEDGVHAVLFRTGRSLGESGQVAAARDHFQHLADSAGRHLGPHHPDTLTARNSLALWQGEAGDAAGAAAAFAELLDHMIRVLGEDHPRTLATRGNLATMRGRAGDAAGAAAAFAELLADRIRVLGEDHPGTLATRGNLATMRGRAGDAAGAAAALAELLDHMIRVLSEDHPDTLITRNNLAVWRGRAGDAAGAAEAFAELLTDRIRVLGEDHPDTLATRGNLASWRGEAGDAAGAAEAFAELLTDRIRVLGEDHPDTLTTRNNLDFWLAKAQEDGPAPPLPVNDVS